MCKRSRERQPCTLTLMAIIVTVLWSKLEMPPAAPFETPTTHNARGIMSILSLSRRVEQTGGWTIWYGFAAIVGSP